MSMNCRVWWPNELASSKSPQSSKNLLLFGWFVSCSSSCLDVVVAFAHDEGFISDYANSAVEEAVRHANVGMPTKLQEEARFTVLGCLLTRGSTHTMVDSDHTELPKSADSLLMNSQSRPIANCSEGSSCLHISDRIVLEHDAQSYSVSGSCRIPAFNHLHWNGKLFSQAELHVIVYETPRFCQNHFSVKACNTNCKKQPLKKPKWIEKLYQKPRLIDLDAVILAINCSAAASMHFDRDLGIDRYGCLLSLLNRPVNFIWRLLAVLVASISTALYIFLQLIHRLAVCGSKVWTCFALKDVFSNTLENIQVRCFQIMYWPIFLNGTGRRSQACVEYAEQAALRRHSLWSSVVMDVFLGNLFGVALLIHSETICKWISFMVDHFTDDVLRTGCVWLMGVPAGFKLNMELAGFLGIISLNAIHIWSTLSASTAFFCSYSIKAAVFLGMLLGITIPASLFSDMMAFGAFHVSTVHNLMSLLYSFQLQALIALWRLFRGRKCNPLRQRLDSYEYSVEQHIVGSLLFTPLLLLLPTISIFYMFFSMINLTINFFCMLIKVIVSLIHATPYYKILLWLVRSRRFPSGIWFDIGPIGTSPACNNMQFDQSMEVRKSGFLLSSLRSNVLTFGQVVLPHYRNIFLGLHGQSISRILMGKSISMKLGSEIPPKMPWMFISYKDYWNICYNAVLACMQS